MAKKNNGGGQDGDELREEVQEKLGHTPEGLEEALKSGGVDESFQHRNRFGGDGASTDKAKSMRMRREGRRQSSQGHKQR